MALRVSREFAAPIIAALILLGITGGWNVFHEEESGESVPERAMNETVLLTRGTSASGEIWELTYRETSQGACIALGTGEVPMEACGFDIPGTTEVGFGGGLKPGKGSFFLYGLTSSRVVTIVATGIGNSDSTEVQTAAVPVESVEPPGVRYFVLERPPIDDVEALVALNAEGDVVQRITLQ